MRLEYRIMWDEGGAGTWTPLEHAFDHRRRALEAKGEKPDGLAVLWVGDASNVQIREMQ